jgi:hypothetical protein
MHDWFRHLRYHVRWLEPATLRHSGALQRQTATAMEAALDGSWALTSRSHSRGTIAVAAANSPITRLGVDVEYADPARPWRDIVAVFMSATAHIPEDASSLCRVWTFGEAYRKAFDEIPAPELLARIAATPPPDDEPIAISARRYWYSEPLRDNFWLSLVWEEAL